MLGTQAAEGKGDADYAARRGGPATNSLKSPLALGINGWRGPSGLNLRVEAGNSANLRNAQ